MSIKAETLWTAFHAPLKGFVKKRVSSEAAAEDIVQMEELPLDLVSEEELYDPDLTKELTACIQPMIQQLPGAARQHLNLQYRKRVLAAVNRKRSGFFRFSFC